jgi:hypothetical protein
LLPWYLGAGAARYSGDKVRVACGLPADFLGLWCHDVVEVGGGLRKLLVEGVAGEEFGYVAGWSWWISVELIMHLFKWRLLPLLPLVKDLNCVLDLCKPCSLSIYMLPSGFCAVGCSLPASDSFLFLVKVLNLLVNPA